LRAVGGGAGRTAVTGAESGAEHAVDHRRGGASVPVERSAVAVAVVAVADAVTATALVWGGGVPAGRACLRWAWEGTFRPV
jgi:hypothetical protein